MGKLLNTLKFFLGRNKRLPVILFTVVFFIIGIIMIIPFLWMFMISFKSRMELVQFPERFLPEAINWRNYSIVLGEKVKFYILYINSIKITAINVFGGVLTSALAGYAFSRLKFKGRDSIFLIYLATLMIPPQVTIIPKFILFNWFHIIDSHLSLILPGVFSVIGTFMLRQYFLQIPFELSESAYIDGAGEYRTFAQIILPLAKPALMSIVILNFSWHWNDYENPLIFLRSKSLLTLPLGMNVFAEENQLQIELIATAGVLSSFPVILVFLCAQRNFINGLVAGAIKG